MREITYANFVQHLNCAKKRYLSRCDYVIDHIEYWRLSNNVVIARDVGVFGAPTRYYINV